MPGSNITVDQLMVLLWSSEGRPLLDIAKIEGLSKREVERKLHSISMRLNASSLEEAHKTATLLGLI